MAPPCTHLSIHARFSVISLDNIPQDRAGEVSRYMGLWFQCKCEISGFRYIAFKRILGRLTQALPPLQIEKFI